MQLDSLVGGYLRQKSEPDAELAELDGYRAAGTGLQDRNRKFATHQKAGLLAVGRHQIGLRQDLQKTARLQIADQDPKVQVRAKGKDIESVRKSERSGGAGGVSGYRARHLRRRSLGKLGCADAARCVGGSGGEQVHAECILHVAVKLSEFYAKYDLLVGAR